MIFTEFFLQVVTHWITAFVLALGAGTAMARKEWKLFALFIIAIVANIKYAS